MMGPWKGDQTGSFPCTGCPIHSGGSTHQPPAGPSILEEGDPAVDAISTLEKAPTPRVQPQAGPSILEEGDSAVDAISIPVEEKRLGRAKRVQDSAGPSILEEGDSAVDAISIPVEDKRLGRHG